MDPAMSTNKCSQKKRQNAIVSGRNRKTIDGKRLASAVPLRLPHYCGPFAPQASGPKARSRKETERGQTSTLGSNRPSARFAVPSKQQSENRVLAPSVYRNEHRMEGGGLARPAIRKGDRSRSVPARPKIIDDTTLAEQVPDSTAVALNKSEIQQWEGLILSNDKSKVPITTSTSIESEDSLSEWVPQRVQCHWSRNGPSPESNAQQELSSSATLLDISSTLDHTLCSQSSKESASMTREQDTDKHKMGRGRGAGTSTRSVYAGPVKTNGPSPPARNPPLAPKVSPVQSTAGKNKKCVTSRGDEASAVNVLRVQIGQPKPRADRTACRFAEDDDSFWISEWSNPGDGQRAKTCGRKIATTSSSATTPINVRVKKQKQDWPGVSPRVQNVRSEHPCFLACHAPGEQLPFPLRNWMSDSDDTSIDEMATKQWPSSAEYKCEDMNSENVHLASDLTIVVGQRKFLTHKFVLYHSSGYFRALIQESNPGPLDRLELDGVPEQIFDVLYVYMYTGNLKVTQDNFSPVLDAANQLEMPGALCGLLDFLKKSFDVTCAISLYNCCVDRNVHPGKADPKLLERSRCLLVSHFAQTVKSDDFLRLPLDSLLKVLRDDDVTISSELQVFWAAHRWLVHDWNRRKQHVKEVMLCVRFALMPQEDLLACLQEMQRWKMADCADMKDLMMEAMAYKMYQQVGHKVRDTQLNVAPRSSCIARKSDAARFLGPSSANVSEAAIAFLCDGNIPRGFLEGNSLCSGDNDWSFRASSPTILLVGGADPFQNGQYTAPWLNKVHTMYVFNPSEERWQSIGLSPRPWHHPGTADLNGVVYVCGGSDLSDGALLPGPSASAQAWCFNTRRGVWNQIPDMKTARIHHKVLISEGKIYAIGGFDNNNRILNSVECYNPLVNRWNEMSAMPYECLGMAACEFQELFWICGGMVKLKNGTAHANKGGISDVVQVYNPRKNKWYMSSPLRMPRAFASLSAVKNQLFLIGGISPPRASQLDAVASSVSDIDIFDVTRNEWRHYTDLFLPRHCCGSATIGNHLYIVGGMSTALGEVLKSVERFDAIHRKWVCLSAELPVKLAGMGCVVIPPNNQTAYH